MRVVTHVATQSRRKLLFPHPALEHLQHRAALRIRDAVKGIDDVIARFDRLPDLARRNQTVCKHRTLATLHATLHLAPLGMKATHDLGFQKRRQRFVQPQIIPERQRHQVTRPLVSQLMRSHGGKALPGTYRLLRRQNLDQSLTVGNKPRMLHRPTLPRHRNLIELVIGIGNPKVVL